VKSHVIPIGPGRAILLLLAVAALLSVPACGGSGGGSSDQPGDPGGGGKLPEPSAFQFIDQNVPEAAFLVADNISVFLEGLSDLNGVVIELLEDGVVDFDLSGLCDGSGTAVFNATPPLGPGGSALITLTNCIDGAIGGTITYGIGLYDADAVLPEGTQIPVPFIGMSVRVRLEGEGDTGPQQTDARFRVMAFRDANTLAFFYDSGEEGYWTLVENEERSTLACFEFAVAFRGDAVVFGDRAITHRSRGSIVNARNRIFTFWNSGAEPELVFERSGDTLHLVGGGGLTLRPEGVCPVIGAPDGITPGTGYLEILPNPAIFDGVILRLHTGAEVRTTWGTIIDDD
jgi:hypothetical protein